MKVPLCIVLLAALVCGQPPPPPPTDTTAANTKGPGAPGALPDQNPWHELLHRMMELMQSAAGMGPTQGPGHASNQITDKSNQGPQQQGPDQQPGPGQQGPGPQQGQGPQQGPDQYQNQGPQQGPDQYTNQGQQQQGQYQNQGPQGQGQYAQDQQGQFQNQGQQGQYQNQGQQGQGQYANQGQNQYQNPGQQQQGQYQNQGQGQQMGGPYGPAPTTPPAPPAPTTKPRPVVQDCLWEGKYYRPGSDIVRGQHDRWCYVTYCDSMGNIQFWDDYNCPPNSMKPTSGHSAGRPGGGPPTAAPPQPTQGCNHNNLFYEPGQEITNHQVGERCYGTYCSHDSQVIQWEDWCVAPTSPQPPTPKRQPAKQAGKAGRAGNGKRAGKAGGRAAPKAGPPAPKASQVPRQAAPPKQAPPRRKPSMGCYHNNLYYQPNEDVIVGNIGDMCYGYYCEGDNVFVHWEDRCAHPPAAAPAQPAHNTGMGGNSFFFK